MRPLDPCVSMTSTRPWSGEVKHPWLRRMVIDLKGTTYLSSSGLVALHSIALLFRGHEPLDSDQGWASLHAVSSGLGDTPEKNVKLLDPQPNVAKVLERSGMTAYFEVYTDLQKAVEAF